MLYHSAPANNSLFQAPVGMELPWVGAPLLWCCLRTSDGSHLFPGTGLKQPPPPLCCEFRSSSSSTSSRPDVPETPFLSCWQPGQFSPERLSSRDHGTHCRHLLFLPVLRPLTQFCVPLSDVGHCPSCPHVGFTPPPAQPLRHCRHPSATQCSCLSYPPVSGTNPALGMS